MKKRKDPEIIYYKDELNDDFANNGIDTKASIPNDYKYINKSPFFKVVSFLLRFLFAIPVLWLANLLVFRPKVKNKKLLKQLRRKGYYVYCNHVLPYDPIILPVKTQPWKAMLIISGHELFSIGGIVNWLVKHFYAIPIPNQDAEMAKNYENCLSYHIKKGHRVLIYPEAHIWPYYNGIRPFKPVSFKYAVNDNAPIVVATTTFKQRKGNKKPKPIIYLDGPFYPDETLSVHDRVNDLRNRAYEAMKWRAGQEDNYAYIKYIKKED